MKLLLAKAIIIFAYYIIGAYGTTDIIRLSSAGTSPVADHRCYCPHCGAEIRLYDQVPIISYLILHGKCRNCGAKIPVDELFLEISILSGMTAISVIFDFSWIAYILSIGFYECVKLIYLIQNGITASFRSQLFRSILNNLIIFTLAGVLFAVQILAVEF